MKNQKKRKKILGEKYDRNNNREYYLVVTEELLVHGYTNIPNWIKVAIRLNSSGCLRLYLSHHLYEEAADVILYVLTHETKSINQSCLPYTQIDQLLKITSTNTELIWKDKLEKIKELFHYHSTNLKSSESSFI